MYSTKIGFLCFLLAMGIVYAASPDKAILGKSIFVKNLSGFSASLRLLYRVTPEKFVLMALDEELPVGQSQTLVLPLPASAIDFFVFAGTGNQSTQVCSDYYPEMPRNKCYQISGSVEAPLCAEFLCPA